MAAAAFFCSAVCGGGGDGGGVLQLREDRRGEAGRGPSGSAIMRAGPCSARGRMARRRDRTTAERCAQGWDRRDGLGAQVARTRLQGGDPPRRSTLGEQEKWLADGGKYKKIVAREGVVAEAFCARSESVASIADGGSVRSMPLWSWGSFCVCCSLSASVSMARIECSGRLYAVEQANAGFGRGGWEAGVPRDRMLHCTRAEEDRRANGRSMRVTAPGRCSQQRGDEHHEPDGIGRGAPARGCRFGEALPQANGGDGPGTVAAAAECPCPQCS